MIIVLTFTNEETEMHRRQGSSVRQKGQELSEVGLEPIASSSSLYL